jgi:lipoate-protein ligase B
MNRLKGRARAPAPLRVVRLGLTEYQESWALQQQLAEARNRDRIPDTLLLLEHPHTYTLGRRGRWKMSCSLRVSLPVAA